MSRIFPYITVRDRGGTAIYTSYIFETKSDRNSVPLNASIQRLQPAWPAHMVPGVWFFAQQCSGLRISLNE